LKKFKFWAAVVVALAVLGGGLYGWWSLDLRWRPKTIKQHPAEIAKILESAGWVSPGNKGPKLYMVSYRSCTDCIRYEEVEFPKLQKAGVDTRVIVVVISDKNGVNRSTAPERATVAELWANRKWSLLEAWKDVPPDAWKADGIAPADGDLGRTALVAAGKQMVADLQPLLKDNGIAFAYPTLIWWTKDGRMRGCACEKEETYANVRRELGA
jgi:hypothetical protein